MFNKIYEKLKNFIKKFGFIFIYILIFIVLTMNLPYYISAPGGLMDTKDKIENSDFEMSGSLNMAYVTEIHATIPTLIWAFFDPDWDVETEAETVTGSESVEDMEFRNKMMLEEASNTALKLAYDKSDIEYKMKNIKVYLTYIDDLANTNLEVGDQIIEADGHKISTKEDLYNYISTKKVGDKVNFKVIRDNEKQTKTATLIDVLGEPKVGALLSETFDLKSDHPVELEFKDSESGPSGGLMLTLTLYSYLNEIDLTHGHTIVGTGTIDEDGNVGEISGVKYKLIGAVDKGADIFLVPDGDNYKEAKKVKEEKGYKIDLVPVKTFDEALEYLENL